MDPGPSKTSPNRFFCIKVKYVVLSHAHADHDGGAKLLQDEIPGVHLVYGAADWDAVDKSINHAGGKPKHDMVGNDGMKISVGDASVQIVTMPGHTPGTLSFLFKVRDNSKPLRVAYVGGTAIPFNGAAAYYDAYIASSKRMAKAAADYGATALISNHSEFDNAFLRPTPPKVARWAKRILSTLARQRSPAISQWFSIAPPQRGSGPRVSKTATPS